MIAIQRTNRNKAEKKNNMLKLKVWMVAAVAWAGLALQANAHLIDPDGNLYVGSNDNDAIMSGLLGTGVQLLFKAEYNDGVLSATEGPAAGYITIVHPLLGDVNQASISWDLAGSGYELYGVAWKDGTLVAPYGTSGDKGFYWSAVSDDQRVEGAPETISTSPAFSGAISHISFYGKSVPDGGATLVLLGAGLTALGTARRFLKR